MVRLDRMQRQQLRRASGVVKDIRKKDTREKIILGGLIVKAGLRGADRALLLGALLDLANAAPDSERHARFLAAGRLAFAADRELEKGEPDAAHA